MREGFWTENSICAHRAQLPPHHVIDHSMSIILICQTVRTALQSPVSRRKESFVICLFPMQAACVMEADASGAW